MVKENQIRMAVQLTNLIESKKEDRDQISKLLQTHHEDLNGNGHDGLKTKVDRLEQWRSSIVWMWTIVISLLAKAGYDLIFKR